MITYEWIAEEIDPDTGDVHDVHHGDTYLGVTQYVALSVYPVHFGLTRNVGNDLEGLTDRSWAYIKGGQLPVHFEYSEDQQDGPHVPVRFHRELAKSQLDTKPAV